MPKLALLLLSDQHSNSSIFLNDLNHFSRFQQGEERLADYFLGLQTFVWVG
jgi:hypothetical protein